MAQLVEWGYYSPLYSKATIDNFSRYEALAEREVRDIVGILRWVDVDITQFYGEQLKDCICKVIDYLIDVEDSPISKGVIAVSNDGYSESFNVSTKSDQKQDLKVNIKEWLSGTGLVGAY